MSYGYTHCSVNFGFAGMRQQLPSPCVCGVSTAISDMRKRNNVGEEI
jgi:hypothetical protein